MNLYIWIRTHWFICVKFDFILYELIHVKWVMLVVPLLNSSISILVLCCSCVSFLASNGKYLASVRKFRYGFFWVNELIIFDAFFFVAKNTQQLAKRLQSYHPYHTRFFEMTLKSYLPNHIRLLFWSNATCQMFFSHCHSFVIEWWISFNNNKTWSIRLLHCQFNCPQ